ncbi:MAG TPA: efflux RND transporter periplasmic adaptor subunit [Steroidobacteraceae bacterium]|nr:efflux RND transporter periplasmic adaptor subunit [Steroidobacteraceae bacterium]
MSNIDLGGADASQPSVPRSALVKPLLIVLAVAAVILGGILGFQMFVGRMMGKFMAASANAPQTVSTYVATRKPWQLQTQAVGSVRAVHGADLAAQIAGVVDRVDFHSGEEVRAGATLLRLRPNDDPAKLEELRALARLAAVTYRRDLVQLAAQAVSQATVDADAANLKSARAQVAAQRALIDEKIIKAPFAGRLGIRQVDEGQYLSAGATVVTLQALDPILIDFYVPQQALAHLRQGQNVDATVDTYKGTVFHGVITAINSKVDPASRNVQARASFDNADRRLVPGMYANVQIDNGPPQRFITLPQAAITYAPYGDTVFVVQRKGGDAAGKARLVAEQRFVTLGATRGDQVAVLRGIAVGEVIVASGQIKLHTGTPVAVNNSLLPSNAAKPTPPNE